MKNITIEQNILGLLLDDGSRIAQCNLALEDFTVRTHQIIFESIQQVIAKNVAVDIVTVGEHIEKSFGAGFVDMTFLLELVTKCAALPENMEHFSSTIKKVSTHNKARQIMSTALMGLDSGIESSEVVAQAIKTLMGLENAKKKYEHTLKDAVIASMEAYQEASNHGGMIGVASGLTELDDSLGGFHRSDLIIIGARPAVGKTALAINFANNADCPVGFVSAEQSFEQIGSRLICIDGMIDSKNYRAASMTEFEYNRMVPTVNNLKNKPIYINDEPGISISTVQAQARRWKQERNIGILFVDYVQKLKGTSKSASNIDRVTEIVITLKELAKELDIPIVGISKVTRAADNLDGPPEMGHLSDASICEYESDEVITMYSNDDLKSRGKILLHICKNRHGPIGDILVDYQGKYFKFTDSRG